MQRVLSIVVLLVVTTLLAASASSAQSAPEKTPPQSDNNQAAATSTESDQPASNSPATAQLETVWFESAWYIPTTLSSWIQPSAWGAAIELGMNAASGNSDTLTLKTGAELERKTDSSKTVIDINYAKASANHLETQHYALLKTRQDLFLNHSHWNWFTKQEVAYDEFKAFDLRWVINSGIAYRFADSDEKKLTGRFGAGVSREFGGPDNRWIPEAVFGADWKRKLTEQQEVKATFDYLPSWNNWDEDFRITADLAWEIRFDQPENLRLKVGIIDRYDNTPNGAKANDFAYSLLLLWKK